MPGEGEDEDGARPVLPAEERHVALHTLNNTPVSYPSDTLIHELFEAQVARTPDAIAVTHDGRTLTYEQLNRKANQLARSLRGQLFVTAALGMPHRFLAGTQLQAERTHRFDPLLLGQRRHRQPARGQAIVAAGQRRNHGRAIRQPGVQRVRCDAEPVGLSADLAKYTDLHLFAQAYPERFFQMGMAEQLLMGAAAGMAHEGAIPFATTYAVFAARRAYDFIHQTIAEENLNVKLACALPGLTSGYGPSHQAAAKPRRYMSPYQRTASGPMAKAIGSICGSKSAARPKASTPIV